MHLRWLLAALHLLGLGFGLGAVWVRGRALTGEVTPARVMHALRADTWWGVAAALWIVTGVARAFTSIEKGPNYYVHNHLFLTKMVLFVVVLALEIMPMIGLIRWRIALAKGAAPDTRAAGTYARISTIQAILVILMVVAATGMARGIGSH
jgi:putative membrane protein